MAERPLGAQISHMLKARGVCTIFGIPGVHNQELYRGIAEAGLRHVLARHEQGAGFMADGYARATERPGVAYVITGPGLCNIMTPMGQAYADRVPLLVISSCLNRADLGMGRGRLHEMKDQEIAAGTVTDWSLTAQDAASAYLLIDRALTEFASGSRRPKHIQVPIEVLEALAPAPPPQAGYQRAPHAPDLAEIAGLLAAATRPLFIFGGGALGAQAEVRAVLDATQAASFLTYRANGLVGPDEPLCFGTSLARPGCAEVIASADLVIAVGSRLSQVDLWRDDLGHQAPLVRVDTDAAVLTDQQGARYQVQADAADVMRVLADAMPTGKTTAWTADEVQKSRGAWRIAVDSERPGLLPVIDALAAALPDETMVYTDMTQIAYAALDVWQRPQPGLWHHPSGFGTLGYALPAAIGGAIARPGAPTVAIAGDYGFQYTLQELMVAVELAVPLPVIIWDNGKLGEIEDSMVAAQIAPIAVIQRNPDFLKFAESFGAQAVQPATLGDLEGCIAAALRHAGPTLILLTSQILH